MAAAGANKALLCFCLLMLIALSSATAREGAAGGAGDRDTKTKSKCFRPWDGYCLKNKKCVDRCLGDEGKGYTHGHCELWTCVCCKRDGEDGVIAPSAQLSPESGAS